MRERSERERLASGQVQVRRVEVPVKVPLAWWQKTLMGCGAAALAFVFGRAVRRLVFLRAGR